MHIIDRNQTVDKTHKTHLRCSTHVLFAILTPKCQFIFTLFSPFLYSSQLYLLVHYWEYLTYVKIEDIAKHFLGFVLFFHQNHNLRYSKHLRLFLSLQHVSFMCSCCYCCCCCIIIQSLFDFVSDIFIYDKIIEIPKFTY